MIDDATAYHRRTLPSSTRMNMTQSFQAMVDDGLDENDMESAEHAAEI